MNLTIITITKNDYQGVVSTITSTHEIREKYGVKQIVVDSSSGDVRSKVKKFIEKEIGIEYFWQKPCGISNAFNLGLEKSNSEWVWFVNGGDEILETLDKKWFFSYINEAVSDLVIFDYINDNKIIRKPMFRYLWPPIFNWVPHMATIMKLKDGNQIFFKEDYKIGMDGELWFKLMLNDITVDLVSIPVAKFNKGGASSNLQLTAGEVYKILWKYKIIFLKRWLEILIRYIGGLRYFRDQARKK